MGNGYSVRCRHISLGFSDHDAILKYAPYGKQGLQALSGAACATFLPQAFLSYAIGGVFDIKFLQDIGI